MKIDFYILLIKNYRIQDIEEIAIPFIIWNSRPIWSSENIDFISQLHKKYIENNPRYTRMDQNDFDTSIESVDFLKNLIINNNVYKVKNVDIDSHSKELIYYLIGHIPSVQEIFQQQKIEKPKNKILIFQEDSEGNMQQLTAVSDPDSKIFSDRDLKLNYKIIKNGTYNIKNDVLDLSTWTSQDNLNNIDKVNKDYIYSETSAFGRMGSSKITFEKRVLDNDFLYRILQEYSQFPSTGILHLDIEMLVRSNFDELIKNSKTDSTFKNTVNTNQFLMRYFTLHEYPTEIIQMKPENVSYLEFFEDIVPILRQGITMSVQYIADGELKNFREINIDSIMKLIRLGYIEIIKYLLDHDRMKYGTIIYFVDYLQIFMKMGQTDIIIYIIETLDSRYVGNDDSKSKLYKYAVDSNDIEFFKFIENKFPLTDNGLAWLINYVKHSGNKIFIDYMTVNY